MISLDAGKEVDGQDFQKEGDWIRFHDHPEVIALGEHVFLPQHIMYRFFFAADESADARKKKE